MDKMMQLQDQVTTCCCENMKTFVTTRGEIVCSNCGTCFGSEMVSVEKRAYTPEEMNERRSHEILFTCSGPRTGFSRRYDAKGRKMSGKKIQLFNRMYCLHRGMHGKYERNYHVANPIMKRKASKASVPLDIVRTAWIIYKKAVKMKITAGRSIQAAVTASLYIASRVQGMMRQLDDFIDNDNERKMAFRTLKLITCDVLPNLGIRYKVASPFEMIFSVGNKMGIPTIVQVSARDMVERAVYSGMNVHGKDPRGIAGGALYLASKKHGIKKTQMNIADACNVTGVTLRTRMTEIQSYNDEWTGSMDAFHRREIGGITCN